MKSKSGQVRASFLHTFALGKGDTIASPLFAAASAPVEPNDQGSGEPVVAWPDTQSSSDGARKKNGEVGQEPVPPKNPEAAIEYSQSSAATNPHGVPIFQLNPTSITPAIEEMMDSMDDDVYHFQEIFKNHKARLALLKRLRHKGYQCAAAPSVIKDDSLSAGVLTAARKCIDFQLPSENAEGITADPRFIWSRMRIKGWLQPILLCKFATITSKRKSASGYEEGFQATKKNA